MAQTEHLTGPESRKSKSKLSEAENRRLIDRQKDKAMPWETHRESNKHTLINKASNRGFPQQCPVPGGTPTLHIFKFVLIKHT